MVTAVRGGGVQADNGFVGVGRSNDTKVGYVTGGFKVGYITGGVSNGVGEVVGVIPSGHAVAPVSDVLVKSRLYYLIKSCSISLPYPTEMTGAALVKVFRPPPSWLPTASWHSPVPKVRLLKSACHTSSVS